MSKFIHPAPVFAIGAAQMVVAASTLTFTSKSSPFRWLALVAIAALGHWHYSVCADFSTSGLWNGTCAATNIIYCLHHFDLIILKRADRADLLAGPRSAASRSANGSSKAPHVQQKTASQPSPGSLAILRRAIFLCFSTRSIGTKYQIGNVPAQPASLRRESEKPSRLSFLWRTAIIFAFQYLFLDLADVAMAGQTPEEQRAAYGDGQEYVLLGATREQLATRLMTSVAGSFVMGRIIMDFVYRGMALVAVGSGVTAPEDWPPFFGRMGDSYTVRYFWGKFWHQWLRGPLSATSLFISRHILQLPPRSLLEWYSNVLMTFTLSAAVHVANDVVAGKGIEKGTIIQFQGFAVAMLMEDAAHALYRAVVGKSDNTRMSRWKLWLGYLWVQIVLFVVVPWYLYPSGRMPAGSMWTVPYSVVQVLGTQTSAAVLAGLLVYILAFLGPEI